jgi:hypothetical protein
MRHVFRIDGQQLVEHQEAVVLGRRRRRPDRVERGKIAVMDDLQCLGGGLLRQGPAAEERQRAGCERRAVEEISSLHERHFPAMGEGQS